MGFMGLECVNDSDMAADLAHVVLKAVERELRKGFKKEANEFNTPGPINVALFIEEYLNPEAYYNDEFKELIFTIKTGLEKLIQGYEKIEDYKDKKYHIKCYTRIIKSLSKFLKD